jgi:hypothetical protein
MIEKSLNKELSFSLKDLFISDNCGNDYLFQFQRALPSPLPAQIPFYKPNKKRWTLESSECISNNVEILPLGWLMHKKEGILLNQNRSHRYVPHFSSRASSRPEINKPKLISSPALFCCFINTQGESQEFCYGMIVPLALKLRVLPIFATALNGRNRFIFKTGNSPDFYLDFSEEEFCDGNFLVNWTSLHNQKVRQSISLALEQKTPILTFDQHSALACFVNYYSTAFHGVTFTSFFRPIPNMTETMRCLATIDNKEIKAWIGQHLCEMLVHPIPCLRLVAKYYYDALPKENQHV